MAEQDERMAQLANLTAEKNDLENTHPMAAKLLQDGKDVTFSTSKWRRQLRHAVSRGPKVGIPFRAAVRVESWTARCHSDSKGESRIWIDKYLSVPTKLCIFQVIVWGVTKQSLYTRLAV